MPRSIEVSRLPATTMLIAALLVLAAATAVRPPRAAAATAKPRVIVTTDGEVDDQDSFKRFLLYTDDFDVRGIVYSASKWHWKGDGKGTLFTSPTNSARYGTRTDLRWPGEQWIQDDIGRYAQDYPNLVKNDPGYPKPDQLLSLVKVGNIDFEGEMSSDTDGSNLIKSVLLDDDPSTVELQAWGGINTIARALKSIQDQYQGTPQWPAIYDKVSRKALIYDISGQDITYASYVAPNWPSIRYIFNGTQYNAWGYAWSGNVPSVFQPLFRGPWLLPNIVLNHGALLASYYTVGDGRAIQNDPEDTFGANTNALQRGDFISEGDNPSWMLALGQSLGFGNQVDDPTIGGWAGRFARTPGTPGGYQDGASVRDSSPYTNTTTTLTAAAPAGTTNLKVASVGGLAAGDTIGVDTGAARETATIVTVGTATANTTLLAPAAAGDTNVKVPSVGGFAVGAPATIDGEPVTVTAVGTAGRATTLSAATVAGATNIKVASVNGLVAGDTLLVDTGANAETVRIATVGTSGAAGTGVSLVSALGNAHATAAAVRDQTQSGTGVTFTPALTAAHPAGAAASTAGSGVTLSAPLAAAHAAGASLTDSFNGAYPTSRWFDAIESDFAARANWAVNDFAHANHPPVPDVDVHNLVVPPGQRVTLHASATDPDGNSVAFHWFEYDEIDTFAGSVALTDPDTATPSFTVPANAKPDDTIQLILTATDTGTPAISRYQRVVVTVGTPVPGQVGGTVPATLSLTLGAPATFGAFTPGLAKDYTAAMTANVVSSAGDAALSIADGGATAPGHLVNGAFSLPSALQAAASSPGGTATGGGAISASALTLETWAAPISNDPVAVAFKQSIGANDPLRTGSYSKTLTVTLSTTTP